MENSGSDNLKIDVEAISQELHVRPEVLKRIMAGFAQTLSEKIIHLDDACSKDDVLRMRALLHEIRGTSGNLRLAEVYSAALDLHESVKASAEKAKILQLLNTLKLRSSAFSEFVKKQETGHV